MWFVLSSFSRRVTSTGLAYFSVMATGSFLSFFSVGKLPI